MMILTLFVFAVMSLDVIDFNCNSNLNYPRNEIIERDTTYVESKQQVLNFKNFIKQSRIDEDSISFLFTKLLTENIIPYWLSTPWSFEGHTSTPGVGEIACGYFVSTTLQDVGFNLNRYKLAQQLPINEAKSLNLGKPLLEINSYSTSDRIDKLKATLKEGIYFIGFDQSHVGYIQRKNGQLFLIHSNYINAEGVVIENMENSIVFASYNKIYIAEISTNKELLKKWLLNEALVVISQ